MITRVKFLKDWRKFKEGEIINWTDKEGKPIRVIPIVGLNGSGKSSLLSAVGDAVGAAGGMYATLRFPAHRGFKTAKQEDYVVAVEASREVQGRYFDADTDLKSGASAFDWDDKDLDVNFHVSSMRWSRGEKMFVAIDKLMKAAKSGKYNLLILDEPDQSMSIRLAHRIGTAFLRFSVENDVQIIVALHNAITMQTMGAVYDVEMRKWRSSRTFIRDMKKGTQLLSPTTKKAKAAEEKQT